MTVRIVRFYSFITIVVVAGLGSGCGLFGGDRKVYSQSTAGELLREQGMDAFAQAEFTEIDRLVKNGELSTARSLLANMPRSLRDAPPYHYRVAYLATLDAEYSVATEHIEKARIKGGYTAGAAELAIFLHLLNGEPTRAAGIAAEILRQQPRRLLVWQYIIDAARREPVTKGMKSAVGALLTKYPKLVEARILRAVWLFTEGNQEAALTWMKELAVELPNYTTVHRTYLDMLRTMGDWQTAARVGRDFAQKLAEDNPLRENIVEELESIRLAQLQRKNDPLPAAVRLDLSGNKIQSLADQVPVGVPLNNNDPRDGRPPDYLDESGEPLYFLPYQAGKSFYLGVRPDGTPTGTSPEMKDPDNDYRPRHAFCFLMPEGTQILAARGGIVSRVSASSADGEDEFKNVIEVFHRDGTIARYWHVDRMRVQSHPGDVVYRGQVLAGSGRTGRSRHQHLRFEVVKKIRLSWWRKNVFKGGDDAWWEPYREWSTIPIKFADVAEEDGVPREGRWYRSRNVWVPNVY